MTARRLDIMRAKLLREADRLEHSARRTDDADRRLQLLDDANEARADAEALAVLLMGDVAFIADARQLSMIEGGQTL